MSENFTNRILAAEVQPPDFIWNRIAEQLDAEKNKGFAQKLAEAEIFPPANAWENIQSRLANPESKVVPMQRNWVRYAVAALVIGVLATGAFFLFNTNSGSKNVVSNFQPDTNTATKQGQQNPPSEASSTNNDIASAEAPISKKLVKVKALGSRVNSSTVPVRYASVEPIQTIHIPQATTEANESVNDYVAAGQKTYIPAPEYYTIQAPNGQPVKISTKFTDAVNYLFNSDPNENSSWKTRLDVWRQKLISNPSFIPTATNFLDILELREMMKEQ